ncbi:hypothetical protein GTP56_14965 [Duganella sp. FT134W]|uniref:Uncharacterized protein n=1 Tax=Duganella margarita TaxID=2692170 RepID=A0A7X4KIG6_9BURK|nr:hypothetical protein [Duganella margarita]MYM73493.1 hypothetical protein [Duganella margarita]
MADLPSEKSAKNPVFALAVADDQCRPFSVRTLRRPEERELRYRNMLYGDEFTVILSELRKPVDVERIAQEILDADVC